MLGVVKYIVSLADYEIVVPSLTYKSPSIYTLLFRNYSPYVSNPGIIFNQLFIIAESNVIEPVCVTAPFNITVPFNSVVPYK